MSMKRYRHYKKEMAIVLSCFGSVVEHGMYRSLYDDVVREFEGADVFMAFNSRMVIKLLKKEGYEYKNLPQVLADVDMAGYKNIIVASINLFPTEEDDMVKKTVDGFSRFSLANIRATSAILSRAKETTQFFEALHKHVHCDGWGSLYIIHGTPSLELGGVHSVSYASQLLEKLSFSNTTCSLEGAFPFSVMKESLLQTWKERGLTSIQLVPLLLVSGNHYIKDMAEISEELASEVEVKIVESLGNDEKFNLMNFPLTRTIIFQHIRDEMVKLG